tara:strand:- start:714 stop:1091 length:378 start_codon:yes stop_codon:yes gene_type:complete
MKKINDDVNHPSHYTAGKVECIDAIESATQGLCGVTSVCVAQVIKYVWRYSRKGTPEKDLAKADFYLQKLRDIVAEKQTKPTTEFVPEPVVQPEPKPPSDISELSNEETADMLMRRFCPTGSCDD